MAFLVGCARERVVGDELSACRASESEARGSEFDDSGDGRCVSIDDRVGVFALAEHLESFESSCGDGCFLSIADDAVPSEVLALFFRRCLCVESDVSSLPERKKAAFLLRDVSCALSVSRTLPTPRGQEGVGGSDHALAEVALPAQSIALDLRDTPCGRGVRVGERISDGETFCRRQLKRFALAELALSRLLVGLGAGDGQQY